MMYIRKWDQGREGRTKRLDAGDGYNVDRTERSSDEAAEKKMKYINDE